MELKSMVEKSDWLKTSQVPDGAGPTPGAGVIQGLVLGADIPGRAEAEVAAVKAVGPGLGQVPTPGAKVAAAARVAAATRRRKAGAPARRTRAAAVAAVLTRAAARVKTMLKTRSRTTTALGSPRVGVPAGIKARVKVGAGARRGEWRKKSKGA